MQVTYYAAGTLQTFQFWSVQGVAPLADYVALGLMTPGAKWLLGYGVVGAFTDPPYKLKIATGSDVLASAWFLGADIDAQLIRNTADLRALLATGKISANPLYNNYALWGIARDAGYICTVDALITWRAEYDAIFAAYYEQQAAAAAAEAAAAAAAQKWLDDLTAFVPPITYANAAPDTDQEKYQFYMARAVAAHSVVEWIDSHPYDAARVDGAMYRTAYNNLYQSSLNSAATYQARVMDAIPSPIRDASHTIKFGDLWVSPNYREAIYVQSFGPQVVAAYKTFQTLINDGSWYGLDAVDTSPVVPLDPNDFEGSQRRVAEWIAAHPDEWAARVAANTAALNKFKANATAFVEQGKWLYDAEMLYNNPYSARLIKRYTDVMLPTLALARASYARARAGQSVDRAGAAAIMRFWYPLAIAYDPLPGETTEAPPHVYYSKTSAEYFVGYSDEYVSKAFPASFHFSDWMTIVSMVLTAVRLMVGDVSAAQSFLTSNALQATGVKPNALLNKAINFGIDTLTDSELFSLSADAFTSDGTTTEFDPDAFIDDGDVTIYVPPDVEPPYEPPIDPPPVIEPPPVDIPGDTPPVEPPVDVPPIDEPPPDFPPYVPPDDTPPVDVPPIDEPPYELPPDVDPPPFIEPPPIDEPPVDVPDDTPPIDEPPVDEPPVDEPPVDEPPVDEPPVDEPPVDEPPVDEPPVDEPPVEPIENAELLGTEFVDELTGDIYKWVFDYALGKIIPLLIGHIMPPVTTPPNNPPVVTPPVVTPPVVTPPDVPPPDPVDNNPGGVVNTGQTSGVTWITLIILAALMASK